MGCPFTVPSVVVGPCSRVQQFHLLIKIRNGKVGQIKTRHKFMNILLHSPCFDGRDDHSISPVMLSTAIQTTRLCVWYGLSTRRSPAASLSYLHSSPSFDCHWNNNNIIHHIRWLLPWTAIPTNELGEQELAVIPCEWDLIPAKVLDRFKWRIAKSNLSYHSHWYYHASD